MQLVASDGRKYKRNKKGEQGRQGTADPDLDACFPTGHVFGQI
jgi:hypothetical protein